MGLLELQVLHFEEAVLSFVTGCLDAKGVFSVMHLADRFRFLPSSFPYSGVYHTGYLKFSCLHPKDGWIGRQGFLIDAAKWD